MANLRTRSGMGLTAVTIITLAFVIQGLFIIAFLNLNSLDESLTQRLQMRVFLRDRANPVAVGEALSRFPEVEAITFVGKDEALENLRLQLGERSDLLDLMTENPLPDTFVIKVNDPYALPQLAEQIRSFPEVEEVVYGQESLGKLLDLVTLISRCSLLGMVVIFLATLFIAVNTIRLTVIARKTEIEIRKLVGATSGYIRAPFVFEGIYMGLVSAGLASLAGDFLYRFLLTRVPTALPFLPILPREVVVPQMVAALFGLGLVMGIVGSWLSVRKYLK